MAPPPGYMRRDIQDDAQLFTRDLDFDLFARGVEPPATTTDASKKIGSGTTSDTSQNPSGLWPGFKGRHGKPLSDDEKKEYAEFVKNLTPAQKAARDKRIKANRAAKQARLAKLQQGTTSAADKPATTPKRRDVVDYAQMVARDSEDAMLFARTVFPPATAPPALNPIGRRSVEDEDGMLFARAPAVLQARHSHEHEAEEHEEAEDHHDHDIDDLD
jgi:hypothetical protein